MPCRNQQMLISLQMTAHFVFSAAVLPLWLHPTVANDDDGLAAAAAAHRRCSTGALLLCLPTAAAAADSLHRQSIATASAVIAQSIDHPLSYLISLNAREMALTLRCALICRSGRTALSLSLSPLVHVVTSGVLYFGRRTFPKSKSLHRCLLAGVQER